MEKNENSDGENAGEQTTDFDEIDFPVYTGAIDEKTGGFHGSHR